MYSKSSVITLISFHYKHVIEKFIAMIRYYISSIPQSMVKNKLYSYTE